MGTGIALLVTSGGSAAALSLRNQSTRERVACIITPFPERITQTLRLFDSDCKAIVSLPYLERENNEQYSNRILHILKARNISYLVSCFCTRLLEGAILAAYKDRIFNIHPSLLPQFPGRHAFERWYKSGQPVTGVTSHVIDETIDLGPPIQFSLMLRGSSESSEVLRHRQFEQEVKILIELIGRIHLDSYLPIIGNQDALNELHKRNSSQLTKSTNSVYFPSLLISEAAEFSLDKELALIKRQTCSNSS